MLWSTNKKQLLLLVAVISATTFLLLFAPLAYKFSKEKSAIAADWYDGDWTYRKKITVDSTKVGEDLGSFPLLVSLTTDSDLAGDAQEDGDDILFTSANGTTKLSHEIEKYESSTGELVAWVKTDLLDETDTEIYLYYGNDSATNQENITDVWSNGYVAVWHMSEEMDGVGAGNIYTDSTANNNDGNDNISAIGKEGKIGYGQQFDGNDYSEIVSAINFPVGSAQRTVSIWAKPSSYPALLNHAFHYGNNDSYQAWGIAIRSNSSLSAHEWNLNQGYGSVTIGQWSHLVISLSTDCTKSHYINSSMVGSSNYCPNTSPSDTPKIGSRIQLGEYYYGDIDEIHVASIARTSGWISTEYANQNSPSTFYSLSEEEAADTVDPANPTSYKGYDTAGKTVELASDSWYNYTNPHFEWSGATDDSSGVSGYYLYFGTTLDADPATTSGMITANESGKYFTKDENFTLLEEPTTNETYYFKLKTKDSGGNITDDALLFIYRYDNINPDAPEYINVSPQGCSTETSFSFTWPEVEDILGSGIDAYQYKKGSSGFISETENLSVQIGTYQEGDNVFYLRSADNAGNFSNWQTAIYCSTAITNVTSGPIVSAGPSSMTVTWTSSKNTTSKVQIREGNTYYPAQESLDGYTIFHSVSMIGLKAERNYEYRLLWEDESGNSGESEWYETTTSAVPAIRNLDVTTTSPSTAIVSWNTTQNAEGSIEYGLGNYENLVNLEGMGTLFTYQLSTLIAGMRYQIRVKGTTMDGTDFYGIKDFQTPSLPDVSNLQFESVSENSQPSLRVIWDTNVDTTSTVYCRILGDNSYQQVSDDEKVMKHELLIKNLMDNSIYQIYVSGIDSYGNITTSDINTFQTPMDSRPPTISGIVLETSNVGLDKQDKAQIAVSWRTDEPTTSQVEYGEGISGTEYTNKTTEDKALTTNHLVIIPDLTPGKPYHIRVISIDRGNNTTKSQDHTVIPGDVPRSALQIILNTFSRLFGWLGL